MALIYCHRCGAKYNSEVRWCCGYDRAQETENTRFVRTGDIEEGHCPQCRQPPQLEPTPPRAVM